MQIHHEKMTRRKIVMGRSYSRDQREGSLETMNNTDAGTEGDVEGDADAEDYVENQSISSTKSSSSNISNEREETAVPVAEEQRLHERAVRSRIVRRRRETPTPPNMKSPSTSVRRIVRFKRRKSTSAPATLRRSLLEDHYPVDRDAHVVLPGALKYENDWARDAHDFFNLVCLIPVVVLDLMNWGNYDLFGSPGGGNKKKNVNMTVQLQDIWTGEWFHVFFITALTYFTLDLLWITFLPKSVKRPLTIIQHHIFAMLCLAVSYKYPEYQWCFGACRFVAINTWLLIARRVFNREGFPPWIIDLPFLFSIRVKLISVFFYLTWIVFRLVLYPFLMLEFWKLWLELSKSLGTKWNIMAIVVPLHAAFCALNLKLTYDLVISKVRWWRSGKKGKHGIV